MAWISFINDVIVPKGGGQLLSRCYTKALILQDVMIREGGRGGGKKCSKLRDVIYGRPLLMAIVLIEQR